MRLVAFKASVAYLWRHPWQLILALVGIAVGVAVIVAVDLANSSAKKAFLLSMDAVTGDATHQVIGGPQGVPESIYAELRVNHGFDDIAPVVEGRVFLKDASLTLLGIDLFAENEMRDYQFDSFTSEALPDDGNGNAEGLFLDFLIEPGSVAMSADTAAGFGLAVGDVFEVDAGGRKVPARLVATIAGAGDASLEQLVVCDIATAQEWLERSGWLSRIDVKLADAEGQIAAFEAALPDRTRLLRAASRTQATVDMSKAFMTNLTAMSLLALLVGVFLIFNSVNFSVLQRRNLIGVLRAIGLTRKQLVMMLLAEAFLIGLIASVLGLLLGIVLGESLLGLVSRTINDLYFRVTVTQVQVSPFSVVKGLLAGIGAALLAAAIPAWEATSFQPRLALSRSVLEQRVQRSSPLASMAGIALMIVAVMLIQFSGTSLTAGLAAVLLLILGFGLVIPLFVRFATRMMITFAGRLGGVPGRMAIAGISAGLSRTAVAVVALTVAVSATIGVSVMVDSFRGSVNNWLQQTLQAELYAGVQSGSMSSQLVEEVGRLEGVDAVSTSRRIWLEADSGRTQLRVIRMAPGSYAGTEILDADPTQVWPKWETEDVVLVSEPYAFQNQVGRGDLIVLPTDLGSREFLIAATFQSYDVNASAVLMSRQVFSRFFEDEAVDSVGLYLDEDSDAEQVAEAVRGLNASDDESAQALRVISNLNIRELSLKIFDRTFVITDVLYWLALGVAFIGILSAMLALQLERARELATLRALGMTTRQVSGMILTQTGVVGLLSGLAAIPMGIVMAVVLIKVINRRAFGWQIEMSIGPEILGVAIVFAVVAALLAGIYPAYRAGRSQPALAMREE